jgi:acyl-CoA dehydrogenase
MISFAFTARDAEILEEARAQARLAIRYARDFERDEDRLLPPVYPEAEGRPDTRTLLHAHVAETSGAKIINALLYLEDWRGGVPLREARYSLGNTVLKLAGSAEQEARWADKTIAIALTEPIGGSDPAAARTTATWDAANREWVIEGEKIFITYAESCDAALVLARLVHPERRGLSTFMVEKGTPGFSVGRQYRKLGIRFEDTAGLVFSGCRVPVFNHIDGDLKKTLQSFSESRPVVAAYALGVTRAAMDFTWERLAEAGVTPDYDAGPTALSAAADRMLALEAEWEATYVTVLRAKWVEQNEGPGKIESSVAKTMGGTLARKVTQTCIELLGAAALSEAHPLEKAFRDARIFDIYEGSGEIQRLIIAREILGLSPKELN